MSNTTMSFFTSADFVIFSDAYATDPAHDAKRVRVREKLAGLHQQIYPEMRARRWDLYPHSNPGALISPAHISPTAARIEFMMLRYSKPETVVKLLKRETGEDFSHWYGNAMLDIRVNARGLAVELFISNKAHADGENFKNKLVHGAPRKRHLRQLCAELGGDYMLTLFESVRREDGSFSQREVLGARCSRLVNLGVLEATLAKYAPTVQHLSIATRYGGNHPRLETEQLASEILYRLGQLYPVYQFVSWLPRNDYLIREQLQDKQSKLNS